MEYSTVEVCSDCYMAHHYGAYDVTREATEAEIVSWEQVGNSYHDRQIMGLTFVRHPNADGLVTVTEWFAGESDQRCEGGEPLGQLPEYGEVVGDRKMTSITDNTCSNHFYGQTDTPDTWDDEDDTPEPVCDQCDQPGWEDGITEFTWRSCDGCNSHLGGSRYRLAIHWEEI